MRDPLEEVEEQLAFFWTKKEQVEHEIEEKILQNYGEDGTVFFEDRDLQAEYEEIREELQKLWDVWTDKCLDWLDVYAELFPEE